MMEHQAHLLPVAGMTLALSLAPFPSLRLWQRLSSWMNYSYKTRENPLHLCSRQSPPYRQR